jgi:hypothetical protein
MAFTVVTACWLAEPPVAALYTGGFDEFVSALAAPIATGWSESCRMGIAPTEDGRLVAAHPFEPFGIGRSDRYHRLVTATHSRYGHCGARTLLGSRPAPLFLLYEDILLSW